MTDTPIFEGEEFLAEAGRKFNLRYEFKRLDIPAGQDAEGVPQFKTVDIVEVHIPTDIGHPEIVPCEPREYCKRHPEAAPKILPAYERWLKNQEQTVSGYLLSHVAGIPAGIRKQFEHFGILTAEQLIEATDALVGKVPNGPKYRDAVKRLMEVSEKRAEANKMVKENEDLKARILALEASHKKFDNLTSKENRNG